jgi:hypothetical protein
MRWSAVALAAAAVAVSLAACSGGGKGGAGGANPSNGARGAFQAYTNCLSQHGVTVPQASRGPRGSGRPSVRPSGFPTARPSDGAGGGNRYGFGDQPPPGVDPSTWANAQQACAALRPSGGPQRDNGAITAYRNCLADHGVTLSGGQDQLNSADPKVASAMQICEPLRPTGRPTGRPSPAPSATG